MKHSDCQHCLGISAQNGNQAAIPTSWCIIKLCLLQQHLIAFHNFSSGRSSLMAQDFDKGAAFTRCSGTHHQKVEIAPTLNKRGSLVSTQKFSWISSTRASPRPRSSLGNIREVVPLRVYPQEHRPPPTALTRTGSSWGSHVTESALHRSWVQVLQTRLLPSAGEDLTATEDWKPERSSVRSTVPNTKWTEVKMAGNRRRFLASHPILPLVKSFQLHN